MIDIRMEIKLWIIICNLLTR